jgi:lactaldehyde dehydrogenase/glycolaldehyde dehydrogenase
MKEYKLYVNGEFVDSKSSETITVINPTTEEPISTVPNANADDIHYAMETAACAQKAWGEMPAIERAGYLQNILTELDKSEKLLIDTIVKEQGKPVWMAEGELAYIKLFYQYGMGWARRCDGDIIQSDNRNENILIYKKPIGVVVGICPWNFPLAVIARKLAPALITGNTVVIKSSEITPNNAFEFAEVLQRAGLPKGVVNILSGDGKTGQELVKHPLADMISFTGSVAAGQNIMQTASQNLTKITLELGGKAPAIVCKDADLDLAVQCVMDSRLLNNGQICNAAERVYVQESVADEFIEKMCAAMKEVTIGDPFDEPGPKLTSLVSKEHREKVEAMVARACKDGAEILVGGKRPDGFEKGFFYEPTVMVKVRQDMEIMQKEIFGPVLPIMPFEDIKQAIDYANDSEYGLTSSLYTNDVNIMMQVTNQLRTGETYINRPNGEAVQGFHAGWRKSGLGGEDGKYGMSEYLKKHIVYIQYRTEN